MKPACATVQTAQSPSCSDRASGVLKENEMYIGGILGTILVICSILWLVRGA
jgi:hypothetical protein